MELNEVQDKVNGLLDRLLEFRGLLILTILLLYVDILLLYENIDPRNVTLAQGLSLIESVSLAKAAISVLSFALMMAVVFPAIRALIVILISNLTDWSFFETTNPQSVSLSVLSIAVITLTAADLLLGISSHGGAYQGLGVWLFSIFSEGGIPSLIARFSIGLFLCLCMIAALQSDEN